MWFLFSVFRRMANAISRLVAIIGVMAVIILLLSLSTGCYAAGSESTALVLVVGNHSNSLLLPYRWDKIEALLMEAAASYGSVTVIVADGAPYCAAGFQIQVPAKKGLSDAKQRQIAEEHVIVIRQRLEQACAVTPEVDTLGALQLAARTLQESDAQNKCIVVLDTGLSTTGSLDFTRNLIESNSQVLCEQLDERKGIPNLAGIAVSWAGLGDTALPQETLSPRQRDNLQRIWQGVLEKANARSVSFSGALSSGATASDLPTVSVVSLLAEPTIGLISPGGTVFPEERVRFIPDTAVLTDRAAAMETLRPVAEYMKRHPDFRALLVGTTATIPSQRDQCLRLSRERAEAVRALLVDLEVRESQLETVGLGFENPWHLEDCNPDGTLNANAPVNRKVILLDIQNEKAREIMAGVSASSPSPRKNI